ncbi:O-antigen ligase family protein [Paenibacillus beijingensis]|uniref:O-antigen ligase-related domain-containing protein n=1 Tax=Paenibacillus beijingensis TaxID=1126833 RepID=A0A0D5NI83_9BACL|nr:O-antigen ligase family protein [Paenibacillus beijingensis]AJY74608.1 hypothetical protein VN24_08495 [Paenibacillus beijingensis]
MAAIFFLAFPFQTALFNGFDFSFEKKITGAMLYGFFFFIVMSLHIFKVWRENNWQAVLSVSVWLLPIFYFISSFNAVSVNDAQILTVISFGLAGFFVFGVYFNDTPSSRKTLEGILVLSGYILVIFGLINLFGQIYTPDALWFTMGNYRLTSVFQYPNTYAAVLIAVLLVALYYTAHAVRYPWRFIHAFMLVPVLVSFMLTFSRAAIVIVPVVILILLPFFKLAKQLSYLVYLMLSTLVTFIILNQMESISTTIAQQVQPVEGVKAAQSISLWSALPLKGWGVLLAASLVTALLSLAVAKWIEPWLERKLQKVSAMKSSAFLAPAALLIIVIVGAAIVLSSSAVRGLLPANIADRLENLNFRQHSVLERETFYRNGLKIAADHPLVGAGGGAWKALYQQYQTNPYTSNQAHSYPIQMLVEVGWLGLLVHAAFFAAVFFFYIRSYFRYPEKRGSHIIFFIFSISILLHSFIDFDMSYISISSLVFFCLGCMIGVYGRELKIEGLQFKRNALRLIFPSALTLLSILMMVVSYRQYASHVQFDKALAYAAEKRPLQELLVPLEKAISFAPANPHYSLVEADWMSQAFAQTGNAAYLDNGKKILDKAKLMSPYERQIILAEYRYYKDTQNYENAIASLEEGISKFPWDIDFYETTIQEYYDAGNREKPSNPDQSAAKWNRATELYNIIVERTEQLKALPPEQLQGRRFDVSPAVRLIIAQIQYANKDFSSAIETLNPAISDNLQEQSNRVIVRYYLAALHATGKNDEDLQTKLIAADIQEKGLLEALEKEN